MQTMIFYFQMLTFEFSSDASPHSGSQPGPHGPMPACQSALFFACLPACIVCMVPCLPACLPVCCCFVPAPRALARSRFPCLPACLLASLPACLRNRPFASVSLFFAVLPARDATMSGGVSPQAPLAKKTPGAAVRTNKKQGRGAPAKSVCRSRRPYPQKNRHTVGLRK